MAAALRSLSLAPPSSDAYRQLHDIAWAMTRRESRRRPAPRALRTGRGGRVSGA